MRFLFLFIFLTLVMAEQLLYEPNAPDYRPASLDCSTQSLFDKLAPDAYLSTFMDVLTQVDDIFKLLNNTDEQNTVLTIFCPVNSAFKNELDVYTRDHLEEFLRNHIVMSKIDPDSLKRIHSPLKTLSGSPLLVKHRFFSHKTILNDHALVDTDHYVEAINGFAYKIDHLLRPT